MLSPDTHPSRPPIPPDDSSIRSEWFRLAIMLLILVLQRMVAAPTLAAPSTATNTLEHHISQHDESDSANLFFTRLNANRSDKDAVDTNN